jgi:hypothetical protein
VVWTVARAYSGHSTPASFWLTGLAAAIGASVVAGMSLPARGHTGDAEQAVERRVDFPRRRG